MTDSPRGTSTYLTAAALIAAGLARGEYNDIVLDLAPGEYALLCRQPDVREDRAFAATHRMVEQVSVK